MKDYTYRKVNIDRLLKLAWWLRENDVDDREIQYIDSEKILKKEDHFKFKIFIRPILALPYVFPGLWITNKNGEVVYKYDKYQQTFTSVILCFSMHPDIFAHLFVPGAQDTQVFGGKILSNQSSTKEFVDNIFELSMNQSAWRGKPFKFFRF